MGACVYQTGNTPDSGATGGPGKQGRRVFPLSRGRIIGIAGIGAMLVAAVIAAINFTGPAKSTGASAPGIAGSSHGGGGRGGANSESATLMPSLAAGPQVAVMPKRGSQHPNTPKSSKTPKASASAHPSPSASSTAPSGSPSATPSPVGSGSGSCTHPQLVTSDPNGMLQQAPYFVANNMWNASSYSVTQTLHACSYSNWYVVATMNNNSGDGAVKTYPNAHMDFDSSPQINSFHSITSTFSETGSGSGIYEDAYDIWLNGIATSGSTEVMIWNENHGQVPGGSVMGTVTFDGRNYTVWRSGSYIAFVANTNFSSGTVNLLDFFKYLMAKGWIPSNTTMGQVDYGVELVSTNNAPATFSFTNFSVNTS